MRGRLRWCKAVPPAKPSTLPIDSLRLLEAHTPAGLAWSWTDGAYDPSPKHIRHLSRLFADAVRGTGPNRILVSEPPRHGKSELASKWLPVWFLDRAPEKRVILASYEADFASSWGRKVRNAIEDAKGRARATVAADSASASRWDTSAGGGMVTAGVGGPITGRGADLLLCDDPVKNAEEADSETYRERTWDWWQTTAYTRMEPGGVAIVTMTRWHEDDLAGRIMAADKGRGEWAVVNIPAIAEHGDQLGRAVGEPLWPERYGVADLERIRHGVGERAWSALYQQRPAPAEGARIKRAWLREWATLPSTLVFVQSWDATFKETDTGSFVVGQVWAYQPGFRHRYLVDQVRFRGDFVDTLKAMKALSAKWPKARTRLIEEKANGAAIISVLHAQGIGGVIPVGVDGKMGSKVARLDAVAPLYEAGDVLYPPADRAPWISDHVAELCSFPSAPNDDQVDAASQALSWLASNTMGSLYETGMRSPERPVETPQMVPGFSIESPW